MFIDRIISQKIAWTKHVNYVSPFDSWSQYLCVSIDRFFNVPHGVQTDRRIVLLVDERQGRSAKRCKWSRSFVVRCSRWCLGLRDGMRGRGWDKHDMRDMSQTIGSCLTGWLWAREVLVTSWGSNIPDAGRVFATEEAIGTTFGCQVVVPPLEMHSRHLKLCIHEHTVHGLLQQRNVQIVPWSQDHILCLFVQHRFRVLTRYLDNDVPDTESCLVCKWSRIHLK